MTEKEQQVWRYVLDNRQAPLPEIAAACDVSTEFIENLVGRIGSDNWREEAPAATEGVKFDDGKPRYDLVPLEIEEAIAKVLTFGAIKYGDRNWELGMRWGRPYAALRRHMAAWWGGEGNDPETGMPHTWHAACCIAFIVAFEARGVGTDDRPTKAS